MLPSLRTFCTLALSALLVGQLAGCATAYDSEKSFWNGQTGFSQTQLGPARWQLEFVGNDLVDRETARKYVLKRAGEVALAKGYPWIQVETLTLSRDAVRVTPTRPNSGSTSTSQTPSWTTCRWNIAPRPYSSSPWRPAPETRRAWKPFISQKLK